MATVQSQNKTRADAEQELLLQFFLSQLIYPVDTRIGSLSGINGLSLAENMYGSSTSPPANYTFPDATCPFLAAIDSSSHIMAVSFKAQRANVTTPESIAGTNDVQNIFGRTGGNDSVLLDLGYPTLVTPDGRKYKPLFAPLIVDLDGKININTVGNVRAGTQGQGSNQGLGPWEVSPMWVLNPSATSYPGPSGEWSYLINGRTTPMVIRGKYASSGIPNPSIGSASSIPIPHWYAAWDSDSVTTSGVITTRFSLPAGNNVFPIFPGLSTGTSGYDQTLNGEFTNNPMLYDLSRPWFGAWNLDALYRYGDTGSPWLGCDLFRLCPTSFSNARSRWQVTTHSYHRDSRPAITPRSRPQSGVDAIPGARERSDHRYDNVQPGPDRPAESGPGHFQRSEKGDWCFRHPHTAAVGSTGRQLCRLH